VPQKENEKGKDAVKEIKKKSEGRFSVSFALRGGVSPFSRGGFGKQEKKGG